VKELALRVPADEVEAALDAILPVLPGGAHVLEDGGAVELRILDSPGTPSPEDLRALAGPRLLDWSSAEVSDDWRRRRLERYEPLIVAERFLVRPDWAPAGTDQKLSEIVLEQSSAFGTGLHPTTQACLATLAEVDPGGSLLDCGCGSGVLSIAASRLGFSPVIAVDVSEPTVAAARRNVGRNGAEVDVRLLDLMSEAPPPAKTIVANVPPEVHAGLGRRLERRPDLAIVSGFHDDEAPSIGALWEAHGLKVEDEVRANEWSVLVLR
jgi:ribosomal protein L11 methyltransferase